MFPKLSSDPGYGGLQTGSDLAKLELLWLWEAPTPCWLPASGESKSLGQAQEGTSVGILVAFETEPLRVDLKSGVSIPGVLLSLDVLGAPLKSVYRGPVHRYQGPTLDYLVGPGELGRRS